MEKTFEEKLAFLRTCETGFVTDAMNLLGIKNCWIENVLPVRRGVKAVGQVFTAQFKWTRGDEKSYSLYEVAQACPAGKILVFAGLEGKVLIGENISTNLCTKGVEALVLDGKCRDIDGISVLPMPVFCEGVGVRLLPPDLKITDIDVPVCIGGAEVNPGDVIIGDSDGLVVIPFEKLDEVLYQTEWVAEIEHEAAEALKKKVSIEEFMKVISKKKKIRD